MRERRKVHISRDRWLVSYADFITLLFGLFVVLFAFAKADQKKQIQVSESIDTAFRALGIFPSSSRTVSDAANGAAGKDAAAIPMNIVMGEDVLSPARVKDDLDRIHNELEQKLSNQVATHTVSMKMGRDGLVISLREAGFFASGSATPKPQTRITLQRDRRRSWDTRPTICASRATPTISPSILPPLIPIGNSPRPALPASPGSSSS